MNIPPTDNPRPYATHLLLAWQTELERRAAEGHPGRLPNLYYAIHTELARRGHSQL